MQADYQKIYEDPESAAVGNVLSNDNVPEGSSLQSFELNGTTYTFSDSQTSFVIDLEEGEFQMSADGSYSFMPTEHSSDSLPEVTYTLSESDKSSILNIDVEAVADEPVFTNSNSTSSQGINYSVYTGVYAGYSNNNDSVSGFDGNGASVEQLSALVDLVESSKEPDYSGQVQQIDSYSNVASDGVLAVATTYVYLEAGSTYSFSGSADDSFYLKIGGEVVADAQWNAGNNSIDSQTVSVSESGYYAVEIAIHNQDNIAAIDLKISVNEGEPQVFGTDTLPMYLDADIPGVGEVVYEDDGVTVDHFLLVNSGYEDTEIQLEEFIISLTDTDGSETLSTIIYGAPVGSVISISGVEYTVGDNGTVSVGSTTDFTDMTITTRQDYSGEFTLTFTATATEGSNLDTASVTKSIDVTVYEVNDAPVITVGNNDKTVITVSEEGLVDANADSDGSSDTTNVVTASGTLTVSDDGDNADIKMSFIAPENGLYESNGVDIEWVAENGQLVGLAAGEMIVSITLSDVVNGQVTYEATLYGPIDHSDNTTEDTLMIDFGIVATDSDGLASDTQTVSLVVEDDAPESTTTTDSIELVKEPSTATSFSITSINGEFNGSVFTNGTNKTSTTDSDDDGDIDKIAWDDNDCDPTSISVSEVSSVASTNMGTNVVIGTFTHVNSPVNSSYKSLKSTDLEYQVTVSINGIATVVTLTADLVVDQTSNANTDSTDYISLSNLSSTTVTVGGVEYSVQLAGFSDEYGNILTTFSTSENAESQYSIVANVSIADSSAVENDYATITGNVALNADVGADGGSVVAETITTDDGTLVISSDGTYTFTPSDTFGAAVDAGTESQTEYTYKVKDADGDVSTNTLTLSVSPANNAPVATDDDLTAFAGLNGEYFGTNNQLETLNDFKSLIASKSADATFIASEIDYSQGTAANDVGTGSSLQAFLGDDSTSLSNDPGDTTDGGIRLSGYIYLEAGTYNFKVYADDGYEVTIDGVAVATESNKQSATSETHESFTIEADGYYTIEMLWWDQGGQYVFQPEISSDGGETYYTLGSAQLVSSLDGLVSGEANEAVIISASTLLSNDSDADNDTLSIVDLDNVENGYAYINASGDVVFIPAAGFTGETTFDYTVSDGEDTDTATVTLNVSAGTEESASVTVTVTEVQSISIWDGFNGLTRDSSQTYHAGDANENYRSSSLEDEYVSYSGNAKDVKTYSGNDSVVIQGNANGGIWTSGSNMNSDDDSVFVGGNSGYIETGWGDDKVEVDGSANGNIKVGTGNDNVSIDGNSDRVYLDDGNDTLVIHGNANQIIYAGYGDDQVVIDGAISSYGVQMDKGNDLLVINNSTINGTLNGGDGTDSLYLSQLTISQVQALIDSGKIINFENIKAKDGIVKGDDFSLPGSTSYFAVSIDISNLDSNETISSVIVDGVPAGSSLQQEGVDLTINSDGTYTVAVSNGETSIDNLTIVSDSEADIAEFELTATINTDGENDNAVGTTDEEIIIGTSGDEYLEGTSEANTLIGNAGDDVLFGGHDTAVDTLIGGSGSDIFVLDDTSVDTIQDFDASEDAIDISDLLDSNDQNEVQSLLDGLSLTKNEDGSGSLSMKGENGENVEIATFGTDSNLNSSNEITVVFNNQEYTINPDG
ncbi:beta strand repeat-containing protein [Cycloclasticus pugetii]|uniref:beta strand repeat-containing protein n=1 Tax=Cycloclasticus pugetii TaxID=34068 RepID=UPI003A8EF307